MSAEKHLSDLKIHAATSRAVRFPTSDSKEYTLHEVMESYASEYHAKEMQRKLEDAFKYWAENEEPYRAEIFNNGVAWLFHYLKEQKQDKG